MAQVGAVGAQAGKIELLSQRPNAREDKFMGGGDQKILDILDAVNICNMNFCKLAPFLGNTALNIGILQVSYEMGSFNTQDFYRKPDSLWKALCDYEYHMETDNYLFTTSLFFELLNGNIVTTGTAQQMPTGDYTSNAPVKTRRYAEQGMLYGETEYHVRAHNANACLINANLISLCAKAAPGATLTAITVAHPCVSTNTSDAKAVSTADRSQNYDPKGNATEWNIQLWETINSNIITAAKTLCPAAEVVQSPPPLELGSGGGSFCTLL